ncbi:acyl-CoA dehydrogenase family protein [Citricoccus sp. NPDC055426]|uniref:acyl-CoA dehydrogenase family protein n=1 Tax=Citricoccus sp. NPDC055426 TaxID=3155536 RepID=UPI00342262EA
MTDTTDRSDPTAVEPRSPWRGQADRQERDHWANVARQVADELARDAIDRDRANQQPRREVELLKASGLVDLLVPREYGGHGGHFATAFDAVRILAQADGSISQLLAYHYFNQGCIGFYAPPADQPAWWRRTVEGRWLWGDSVNPVDPDLVLTPDGEGFRLNGFKRFSTGSGVGDVIVVNAGVQGGQRDGTVLCFVLETDREGVELVDDWDMLGQRLTASGSVRYTSVAVRPEDILGEVTDDPYVTLLTPGVQLGFANFYLGVAQGALERGRQILLERKNAWFLSNADRYAEDPVFQRVWGELKARTAAVAALARELNDRYDEEVDKSSSLTAAERGEYAVAIAELKVVSTEVGLETAHRIFEVTGASSTASSVGLDLYWRNVRTHTLHDPVDYKKIEIAQYHLLGINQPLSLYT